MLSTMNSNLPPFRFLMYVEGNNTEQRWKNNNTWKAKICCDTKVRALIFVLEMFLRCCAWKVHTACLPADFFWKRAGAQIHCIINIPFACPTQTDGGCFVVAYRTWEAHIQLLLQTFLTSRSFTPENISHVCSSHRLLTFDFTSRSFEGFFLPEGQPLRTIILSPPHIPLTSPDQTSF